MTHCIAPLTVTEAQIAQQTSCIADVDGVLSGFACLTGKAPVLTLDKLFIAPEAIGKGVGSALLDWALDRARDAGGRQLLATADPHAAGFYLHHGASADGFDASDAIPGRALPRFAFSL
ncbi:GNAT family N-acetyltransferase [Rhodobacteraceae bacterium KN286]|uniref:GNAT family N-acetyltransferase n=2 Tax=Oceanomicrobium pacificus TaxID=2692916 RepID=A0A6B0TVR1_9RHOB|nr:GNAT family N-acetyltransferase [Oceanomicrobium pacificus]